MKCSDTRYEALSEGLISLREANHRDTVDPEVCTECSGVCCVHGGAGIFENVLLIYDVYQRGDLRRDDYEFEAGLSLPAFIARFFDMTFAPTSNGTMVLFFTKTLTSDNQLVSWRSVSEVNDPGLLEKCSSSAGCVFLDSKIEGGPEERGGPGRGCILHQPENDICLTEKPIQCVFYSCDRPYELKQPEAKLAADWMDALSKKYPDSLDRLNALMADEISG